MLTVDGVLYNIALTFLDATILIPLFLKDVGGSPLLIGLAAAIRQLGFILPQIFIARLLPRIRNLTRFVFWSYFICRFAFLFVLFAMIGHASPQTVLITFFIGYTMFSLGEGLIQVPWMDIFGRTISPQNHGRLFGLMQTFGGLGAFGCGLLIQQIIAHPEQYPYPTNFVLIFSLAFVLLLLSTLSFLYVKEGRRRRETAINTPNPRLQKGDLVRTWRNHHAFRKLLIVQTLVGLHQLAMPFYILYVQTLPGIGDRQIGALVMAQVIGGIAGGLLFGALSARWGNPRTILLTILLNALVPLCVLLAGFSNQGQHAHALVHAAFFTLGIVGGGWIGFTNYLLEICNDETRGRLVAYVNTCSAPLAVLPVFSARLLDFISYEAMFTIVLILMLVALLSAFSLPSAGRPRREERPDRYVRPERPPNAAPH